MKKEVWMNSGATGPLPNNASLAFLNLLNYLNCNYSGLVLADLITLLFAFASYIRYNVRCLSKVSCFIMCDVPGIEEVIWGNGN